MRLTDYLAELIERVLVTTHCDFLLSHFLNVVASIDTIILDNRGGPQDSDSLLRWLQCVQDRRKAVGGNDLDIADERADVPSRLLIG
jgi:hypothetical protein